MTKPIIVGVSLLRVSNIKTPSAEASSLISVLTDIDTNAGTGGGGGAVKPEAVEVSGGGEAVSREAGYGGQTASDHYWSVAQYPGGITGASATYGHGSNTGVTGTEGLQV